MKATDRRELFKYVNASQFLPTFCGIQINGMVWHKLRGKDGNGKAIDFTPEEWERIMEGFKKFYRMFCPSPLTVQDLAREQEWKQGYFFKVVNGKGIYENAKATNGTNVAIYKVGNLKDVTRWVPKETPVELVAINQFLNEAKQEQ